MYVRSGWHASDADDTGTFAMLWTYPSLNHKPPPDGAAVLWVFCLDNSHNAHNHLVTQQLAVVTTKFLQVGAQNNGIPWTTIPADEFCLRNPTQTVN